MVAAMETKDLFLGKTQSWNGFGTIKSAPEKTVKPNGEWFMMVNLFTRTSIGGFATIRCMFLKDIASTFESQFRLNDIVYLSGEIVEYRAGRGYTNYQIKNIVNVLDYAFWTDLFGQDQPLSEEKAMWLQRCSDLFDKNAPMPTAKEAVEFQRLHEERAQQNIDRQNAVRNKV